MNSSVLRHALAAGPTMPHAAAAAARVPMAALSHPAFPLFVIHFAVGIASQLALGAAERHESAARCSGQRANLRPLVLLACACAQGLASLEVCQFAGASLYSGIAAGAQGVCA